MEQDDVTDFGFQQVTPGRKRERVNEVFRSVATRYDLMNDLMSFGAHRLWKRMAVHLSNIRDDAHILDLAGGTGDMSALYRQKLGPRGHVTVCDINFEMLSAGRDRLLDKGMCRGMNYVQGDAEDLPFPDNTFDFIGISFGLRNVVDKPRALHSMQKKLKYGGEVCVLEFSRVMNPLLGRLYDEYSFNVIPRIGKVIANDEESYRYLVESIRMHPDQDTLKQMMIDTGFSQVRFHNLFGGIVALHKGYKTG